MSFQTTQSLANSLQLLLQQNSVDFEPLQKQPQECLGSLSKFILPLKNYETLYDTFLDPPSSGESSPCISDSETTPRYKMPSIKEVGDMLTDDAYVEVSSHIERLAEHNRQQVDIILKNINPTLTIKQFQNYVYNCKHNYMFSSKILAVNQCKAIYFQGTYSLKLQIYIKKADLIVGFLQTLCTYILRQTNHGFQAYHILGDSRKKSPLYAAILRNLPTHLQQHEIMEQMKRDGGPTCHAGSLTKIHNKICCAVKCDSIEDAEQLCKKFNQMKLKDLTTQERLIVQAHVHPQCSQIHRKKERSLFPDLVVERAIIDKDQISNIVNMIKQSQINDQENDSKAPNAIPPEEQKIEQSNIVAEPEQKQQQQGFHSRPQPAYPKLEIEKKREKSKSRSYSKHSKKKRSRKEGSHDKDRSRRHHSHKSKKSSKRHRHRSHSRSSSESSSSSSDSSNSNTKENKKTPPPPSRTKSDSKAKPIAVENNGGTNHNKPGIEIPIPPIDDIPLKVVPKKRSNSNKRSHSKDSSTERRNKKKSHHHKHKKDRKRKSKSRSRSLKKHKRDGHRKDRHKSRSHHRRSKDKKRKSPSTSNSRDRHRNKSRKQGGFDVKPPSTQQKTIFEYNHEESKTQVNQISVLPDYSQPVFNSIPQEEEKKPANPPTIINNNNPTNNDNNKSSSENNNESAPKADKVIDEKISSNSQPLAESTNNNNSNNDNNTTTAPPPPEKADARETIEQVPQPPISKPPISFSASLLQSSLQHSAQISGGVPVSLHVEIPRADTQFNINNGGSNGIMNENLSRRKRSHSSESRRHRDRDRERERDRNKDRGDRDRERDRDRDRERDRDRDRDRHHKKRSSNERSSHYHHSSKHDDRHSKKHHHHSSRRSRDRHSRDRHKKSHKSSKDHKSKRDNSRSRHHRSSSSRSRDERSPMRVRKQIFTKTYREQHGIGGEHSQQNNYHNHHQHHHQEYQIKQNGSDINKD